MTRQILFRGGVLTLAGIAMGLYAAGVVAGRLAEQLHDVGAWDPLTWISSAALIALVSLASVYSAAVLAARTDPSVLLRTE